VSIEDLQSDLERNLAELDNRAFTSFDDVRSWLRDTLFPLMTNMTSEIEEIDNDVADMVQQSEDILQPETAGLFAMVIANCIQLAGALGKRLKQNPNDQKWAAKIQQSLHVCELATKTLQEITVQPDAPDDDGESDEGDDTSSAANGADDVVDRALSSVPPSNENGGKHVNG
jgi:hypothetical protein